MADQRPGSPADEDLTDPASGRRHGRGGLTGGYYWLPTPSHGGIAWSVVTCHDLSRWDGAAHREMWPGVVEQLAGFWGKAPEPFRRRLGDHYYALPRGRVTRPKGNYLILHGNDSPLSPWVGIVIDRFRLHGLQVHTPWDEHERTLREDVLALEEALGIVLDFPRV